MLHLSLLERLTRKASGYMGKMARLSRSFREEDAHPDDFWAQTYLTPGEQRIYLGMDARDREHACRVTRHLLREQKNPSPELIAAALLHDSGKSVRRYNIVERVLVGLIPNRIAHILPPIGAIGIRAAHPELGAQLIAHAGGRPRVAQLVVRHHHSVGDPEAALLHHYDEKE
ncbi:HD domain-containing protein [Deinococcus fonticola]|uniref:HD domain-containing protein n=1 Tax=Deinococcus fonticola TaxID=2528713 RepID=UPI001074F724|nr:HD domain-containing protein [Deinococcus fonticola]